MRAVAVLLLHAGRSAQTRRGLQPRVRGHREVLARQPGADPAARAQRNARWSLRVRRARDPRNADRGARARKAAAKDELTLYRAGAAARNGAGAWRMGSGSAQSAGVRL